MLHRRYGSGVSVNVRYGRRILAILLAGILFITNWGMNNTQTMVQAADAKNYANVVVFAYFKGDSEGASYFQTNRAKILGFMMAPRTVLSRIICLLFPMENFV